MYKKYFTSDEIYEFDQYTINTIGIPSPVLMERAAYSVVLSLKKQLTSDDVIIIFAGVGNNGADAVAVARMLFLLNYNVELVLLSQKKHSKEMAQQVKIAKNINVPISYEVNEIKLKEAIYIIDGIFGIGLLREIEGNYRTIIEQINQQKQATIIALDIPSGLSAKTGETFKTVVQADSTYTFGFFKKGMDTTEGKKVCGKIITCDIGYPYKQLQNR